MIRDKKVLQYFIFKVKIFFAKSFFKNQGKKRISLVLLFKIFINRNNKCK